LPGDACGNRDAEWVSSIVISNLQSAESHVHFTVSPWLERLGSRDAYPLGTPSSAADWNTIRRAASLKVVHTYHSSRSINARLELIHLFRPSNVHGWKHVSLSHQWLEVINSGDCVDHAAYLHIGANWGWLKFKSAARLSSVHSTPLIDVYLHTSATKKLYRTVNLPHIIHNMYLR
jgi:hypothetical protein